jgi:DMSO/TMAO reductase YedYZ molybdopterin-dependent catalytic subunit
VPEPLETRLYGRRAFLGATAVGLSSLLWGRSAWNAFVSVAPPGLVPGWRIYTVAATMPRFDPASWQLRIDGLVQRESTLSYDELRSLPSTEQVSTFHCVTGWTVHHVHWRGVRFADLLGVAAPLAEARVLTFTSAERPYVDTLTLDQARLPDAMLAYEMNGKPLAREHGAPIRVVIPDMYGYKGVKWVERITLSTEAEPGYWEQRGYDTDAWVGRSNGF